jgi:hypothetical protein
MTSRKAPRNPELDRIRSDCEALVRKRALVSAGVAVVPVPLLDVVVDASILTVLVPKSAVALAWHPSKSRPLIRKPGNWPGVKSPVAARSSSGWW